MQRDKDTEPYQNSILLYPSSNIESISYGPKLGICFKEEDKYPNLKVDTKIILALQYELIESVVRFI